MVWQEVFYLLLSQAGFGFTKGHFTQEIESPWPWHFKHSHWWKRRSRVQVHFTLPLRDQRSMWMQDGCKIHMDSYMTSNGSCFMVTWTILKNHLLEVGLTQNQETMAHRMLTTVKLFYFIIYMWEPTWIEIHWNTIWLRVQSHMASHWNLRIHDHTTWFWTAFGHFLLGSHEFHGHSSWLMYEVALSCLVRCIFSFYLWESPCHSRRERECPGRTGG